MSNKVLDKIKKLLRLAASSNQYEAALALSRAQKLMQTNGIQASDPRLAGVQETITKSRFKSRQITLYVNNLIGTISGAFGCEAIVRVSMFDGIGVVFIGHGERPEVASYVYDVLERKLSAARKEYIAGLSNRMKRATKTARADSFCEGWVWAVSSKITAFALTDEEKEQVSEYKISQFKTATEKAKPRQAKKLGSASKRESALQDGFDLGRQVELNHGVNSKETAKLR
ncbi:DUF2786 domain-containing protein [Photobacterium damselae subsp. damselae]|uniref:DUF2786 domain-containing protein n=1 Tax=Photobacterium damselae TaxID=38293 RepID=UPI001F3354A6|nr:DUF2786 domain-containing protein [Photobacterium damselae]UJZ95028.1 DUF2786 domain-containing protein [Photobacterium damselae subsp. damselae]UJZ99009.1 DUF2786 domain-containing protein [Photobacterium damselae subsp. damselae]